MNKIIIHTLLVVLYFLPLSATSQSIDDDGYNGTEDNFVTSSINRLDERCFNIEVFRMLNSYELYYEDITEDFEYLFSDNELMIYNDLIGLSDKETIEVGEYIRLLHDYTEMARCTLSEITLGDVTEDEDNWYMQVSFYKNLAYYVSCDVYLSSKVYYGADFYEVATFAMDKQTRRCSIVGLTGSIETAKKRLGREYYAVRKRTDDDADVLANGKPIKFDMYDMAIFLSEPQFEHPNIELKFKVLHECNTNDKVITFECKPIRWKLKPRLGISLGDSYSFDISGDNVSTSSSGMEYGLDFGYTFPSNHNTKFSLFTGLGYSSSKLETSIKDYAFSYATRGGAADIDGDDYVRHYEFSSISQTLSLTSLMVPVYLDVEHYFNNRFSIYGQLGAKMYYKLNASVDDSKADAFIYGVYPKYDNLYIDESYMNGFGERHFESSDFADWSDEVATMSFDAFTALGFRFSLNRFIAFDLGFYYQMGLTNVFDKKTDIQYNQSVFDANRTPVSYTVDSGETIVNPIDASEAKRSMFGLNIGLIFKL